MGISLLKKGFKVLCQFIGISLCFSCNPDLDYTVKGYTQKIIVEGIVETGKHPEVYLSLNVPLWKSLDSASILDHVIRYAKVTISDGENTEILTSRWDKTHFPPYVYKATELVGTEGRNYSLKVEYGGYTVTSNTYLPVGTPIDSVSFGATATDTLVTMSVWVNIGSNPERGFRIYTKKQKDKKYIETPVVFNSGYTFTGRQRFNLSPQPAVSDSSYSEGQYFVTGDTVDIRICTLDRTSTDFFKELTIFSTRTGNLFLNEVKPLKSNISEPGFGIWYGNAVRNYRCVIGK